MYVYIYTIERERQTQRQTERESAHESQNESENESESERASENERERQGESVTPEGEGGLNPAPHASHPDPNGPKP